MGIGDGNSAKRDKRRIETAQRREKAMEMRCASHTYESIAKALGYHDRAHAYNDIQKAIAEIGREPAEHLIRMELRRLDALVKAIWNEAVTGDLRAIDRVLRILERRANMLGLDAKKSVDTENDIEKAQHIVNVLMTAQAHTAKLPSENN